MFELMLMQTIELSKTHMKLEEFLNNNPTLDKAAKQGLKKTNQSSTGLQALLDKNLTEESSTDAPTVEDTTKALDFDIDQHM